MENLALFSTTIWHNATSILAILYALYLCSKTNNQLLQGNKQYSASIIIILVTTLYIGTRPITSYADTYLYTMMFNLVQSGIWSKIPEFTSEPFWRFIQYSCIEYTTASGWLLVIAIFYIAGMSLAAYIWLPRHLLIVLIFILISYSFWGYATNVIRAGMATSIAMLGLSFFCRSKKEMIIGYGLLVLASLTHKSCMLTIATATCALFLKNTKVNISFWLFCILLGLIFQEQFKSLFSWLIDDHRMSTYLNLEVDEELFSRTGFRWDFLLYSSIPIIIGWYAISKQKITDKIYAFILHTYIFSNSFWILINTTAYSDRFAFLSWFLYPILIVYPFCKFPLFKNQNIVLGLLLILLTLFTYFQ